MTQPIHLVLLPGMDGTGQLFRPFLEVLNWPATQVIALPQSGEQSYPVLYSFVRSRLPAHPFMLLAESFSGAIAASLLAEPVPGLRGVIFAASFVSPPAAWKLALGRRLPLQALARWPGADWVLRYLMCGWHHPQLPAQLCQVLEQVPPAVLRSRIKALQALAQPPAPVHQLPVLNLVAAQDRLIGRAEALRITQCYPWCITQTVRGSHLLLQTAPEACAAAVRTMLMQGS